MNEAGAIAGRGRDRMGRRVLLCGLAALPVAAIYPRHARAAVPTIGFLSHFGRADPASVLFRDSILEGLAGQGLVAPRNLRWLERYGETRDALQPLARELVVDGADLIVTTGGSTQAAIRVVAGAVPVVYGFSGDPVAAGLADGLSRPRGNATGVTLMMVETNAKRIEILKEIAPSIRRIALVSSPNHPGEPAEVEVCRRTVASLGVELLYMPVSNREDLEKALTQASAAAADALVALPDGVTTPNRERLAAWALERRVPSASGWAMFAESGALMTFGPSVRDCYRRVGYFAARVLAGANPADLPIEQPTRFELVLNRRTARAIDLPLTEAILARADDVIE